MSLLYHCRISRDPRSVQSSRAIDRISYIERDNSFPSVSQSYLYICVFRDSMSFKSDNNLILALDIFSRGFTFKESFLVCLELSAHLLRDLVAYLRHVLPAVLADKLPHLPVELLRIDAYVTRHIDPSITTHGALSDSPSAIYLPCPEITVGVKIIPDISVSSWLRRIRWPESWSPRNPWRSLSCWLWRGCLSCLRSSCRRSC